MDDKHARHLIDRAERIGIYRRLNPCNVAVADNCPAAAQAMFDFLSPTATTRQSLTPARCNEAGQGFIYSPAVRFHAASLQRIIQMVQSGPPGNLVVVHGQRPPGALVNGRRLAPDHYAVLVKLGPPENDVFWADCSRPDFAMFFPSRSTTGNGGYETTITSFVRFNHLGSFEYTRGPFAVQLAP